MMILAIFYPHKGHRQWRICLMIAEICLVSRVHLHVVICCMMTEDRCQAHLQQWGIWPETPHIEAAVQLGIEADLHVLAALAQCLATQQLPQVVVWHGIELRTTTRKRSTLVQKLYLNSLLLVPRLISRRNTLSATPCIQGR